MPKEKKKKKKKKRGPQYRPRGESEKRKKGTRLRIDEYKNKKNNSVYLTTVLNNPLYMKNYEHGRS